MHRRLKPRRNVLRARKLLNTLGLRSKKVFAIGFNKCGTTSLDSLFESLNRPSYHGEDWRSCENLKLLQKYDCFSDGIPADLEKLDTLFPRSQFILQLRDLEGWVYSRLKHIASDKLRGRHVSHPEWEESVHAVKSWIVKRNQQHLFTQKYFASRTEDLLIVNFIRDADAATKVCNFMGYDGLFTRPAENLNPSKEPDQQYLNLFKCACDELGVPLSEASYDIYCPSLASPVEIETYPHDSTYIHKVSE